MQRSIASKDAMIKDLKAKLDTMGELTDRSGIGPGGAPSTSNIDNFAGLSVQELKNR